MNVVFSNVVFSLPIAVLSQYIFAPIIFVLSLFMVLLILVQRGKGGGLTGALGGPGGQSAFGTKAGDLFTRITIVTAAIWIFLLAFAVWWYTESDFSSVLADTDVTNTPSMGASPTGGMTAPLGSAELGGPAGAMTGAASVAGNATGSGNATSAASDATTATAEIGKDDLPATTPAEPKMPAEPASPAEAKTEPASPEPKVESPVKSAEPKTEAEPKTAEPKVEPAPTLEEPKADSPKTPSTEK